MNIPRSVPDNQAVSRLFEEFGDVRFAVVVGDYLNENGVLRRSGVCGMADHEAAVRAVEGLNGRTYRSAQLVAGRALSGRERWQRLADEADRGQMCEPYTGRDLHVRNFDATMTAEVLQRLFSGFGPVESTEIETNRDVPSSSSGIVRFQDAVSAERAIRGSVLFTVEGRFLSVNGLLLNEKRKHGFLDAVQWTVLQNWDC
jgi:RNA recognition motif-containing protein